MACYDYKINQASPKLERPTCLAWLFVCLQVGVIAGWAHASEGPREIILPDFTGMMLGSAEHTEKGLGMGTHLISPVAGTEVDSDDTVDLIISFASEKEDQPFNSNTNQESVDGKPITLTWQDKTLGEILEEVESSSGVKFKASAKVKSESISTKILASNWTDAIRKLLKGYSIMEVTNRKGDLVKVLIMSDTGDAQLKSDRTGRRGRNFDQENKGYNRTSGRLDADNLSRMKKKLKLSRSVSKALYSKLKEIVSWPNEKALPSSMYSNANLEDFLSLNGIEFAEDLKETSKITRLKRAARKQMLIMKKRARASDIELE